MNKLSKETNILIVGLGLLGGSYAEALSKKGYTVRAITLKKEDIAYAKAKGIILEGEAYPSRELISSADLIIFALFPSVFIKWMEQNGGYITAGTLLTDVTGVKGSIVKEIQALVPKGAEYIAAHPMAGREVSGVENSDCSIFNEANYIVVPTEDNTPQAVELCRRLGEELGFKTVSTLSVEEHDKMIAFLSQLTHCIAVSLMCSSDNEELVSYTGDSFRDLTRIAKINENMWSELFLLNKKELLWQMDNFLETFICLRRYLAEGNIDGMKQMMRLSTKRRRLFDK